MQFKVPQFLEIEDKIFGPFTFKEFVYLAGGAGLCYVLYKLLGLVLGAVPILVVAGFAIALARYRPNNKPFIDMIEAGLGYVLQNKLYIWKRRKNKVEKNAKTEQGEGKEVATYNLQGGVRLGGNKLRDLAWSLDVLDLTKHIDNK